MATGHGQGDFYSLDEEENPPAVGQGAKAAAKQKSKAKAKAQTPAQRKLSAAVLAERLETALSALFELPPGRVGRETGQM